MYPSFKVWSKVKKSYYTDLTYNMLCVPVFYILTGFEFKYFLFRDSYLSF